MNIRAKIFGGKASDESPVLQSKKPSGAKPDGLHTVPVKRDEIRKSDTRDEDRHRLPDEQVRVTYQGHDHEVQLINLSGGGAMVAGAFAPKLWDRLQLHLGENGTIECAVRWIKGDRIGLEFAHGTRLDCSADEQAEVLRDVIARSFPDIEFEASPELQSAPAAAFDEEQRVDRRHPLIWSGVIHHDYQSTPVRLRNISATGAMIDCGTPLRAGSELLLELGASVQIFATVAWVFGDAAGLRFDKPFDLAQLASSRPEVTSVKSQRPAYLQTGAPAADTPWDDQWDTMSLGELKQSLEGYLKR